MMITTLHCRRQRGFDDLVIQPLALHSATRTTYTLRRTATLDSSVEEWGQAQSESALVLASTYGNSGRLKKVSCPQNRLTEAC
ncbi:hypothetical protein IE81DRAFT_171486 [Ceraceosorus guamensis]|uniref:Uncharacterized protein n=1 Tax=Ceraceosorus guamensis TaxID=1522189 RepID=A0A316VZ60_9BASI|nr:hypothetical protein IE81DRAFT_171486 [Ceraceosorus guamensis]PWN41551.1 hypothetical protein IE81DRAFT_171486 [Ceraceosorus guamensis]